MPQPRRQIIAWLAGNYYHLFNRGTHHQPIFREPENYHMILRLVQKYHVELELSVIAYCLMPNHYHFLIRQDGDQPAGMLVQRIFNSYSKAYNKVNGLSGTLFERRYQAKCISSDQYLLQICRYIHANPVKDHLVEKLVDWPYSNYLEWTGARLGTLVDKVFISEHFHSSQEYQQFVEDYLTSRKLPRDLQNYLDKL